MPPSAPKNPDSTRANITAKLGYLPSNSGWWNWV